mmetsp:Transcript_27139/g.61835  ORF Transcript_27139/g.61835 Transcript_27139/m.61835 type:complete len:228 (+) Transcript_27139:31-714(+)
MRESEWLAPLRAKEPAAHGNPPPSLLDAVGLEHVEDVIVRPVILVDTHGGQLIRRQATDLVLQPRVRIAIQQRLHDVRVVQLSSVVEGRPALLVVEVDVYGLLLFGVAEVVLHDVEVAVLQAPEEPLLIGDHAAVLLLLLRLGQRVLPSPFPLRLRERGVHVVEVKLGGHADVSVLGVIDVTLVPLPEAQALILLLRPPHRRRRPSRCRGRRLAGRHNGAVVDLHGA